MTFRDLIRIEEKARELGLDALEPEERKALEDFRKASAPFFKALASSPAMKELGHPETIEGMRMWEGLSEEKRAPYANWTPRQFYAMKLLIDEVEERGMLGD
jgi:hypothetical protein